MQPVNFYLAMLSIFDSLSAAHIQKSKKPQAYCRLVFH